MKILVVDDDPTIVDFIARCLRREGHEVASADSGQQAKDCIEEAVFDLLITDIFMPEVDGLELIQQIRRNEPRPIIIAISGGSRGSGKEFYLECAKAMGACRVLAKPFDVETLLAAVNEATAGAALNFEANIGSESTNHQKAK